MADQLPASAPQTQSDSEGQVEQRVRAVGYAGPLPPAAEIQRWEEILPGAAERFLTLLEEQTRHEMDIDREQVALAHEEAKPEHDLRKRGQTFGLSIGFVALAIGGGLVVLGNPITGTIFGGTGVGSLVGAFLYDRHQTKKDRLQDEEYYLPPPLLSFYSPFKRPVDFPQGF